MTNSIRKVRARIAASSYALGFIVLFLTVYVLVIAQGIIIPLVIAVFIWYLINAIARVLMNWHPRGITIPRPACFAAAMGVLLLGIYGIFAVIRQNVGLVIKAAPGYQDKFVVIQSKVMVLLGL